MHRPGVCHLCMCGKDTQAILEGTQALLHGLRHNARGRRSAGLYLFRVAFLDESFSWYPTQAHTGAMPFQDWKVDQQSLLC